MRVIVVPMVIVILKKKMIVRMIQIVLEGVYAMKGNVGQEEVVTMMMTMMLMAMMVVEMGVMTIQIVMARVRVKMVNA